MKIKLKLISLNTLAQEIELDVSHEATLGWLAAKTAMTFNLTKYSGFFRGFQMSANFYDLFNKPNLVNANALTKPIHDIFTEGSAVYFFESMRAKPVSSANPKNMDEQVMEEYARVQVLIENPIDKEKMELCRTDEEKAIVYFKHGRSYFNRGDYQQAIDHFNQAINLGLNNDEKTYYCYLWKGNANFELSHVNDMKHDISKALQEGKEASLLIKQALVDYLSAIAHYPMKKLTDYFYSESPCEYLEDIIWAMEKSDLCDIVLETLIQFDYEKQKQVLTLCLLEENTVCTLEKNGEVLDRDLIDWISYRQPALNERFWKQEGYTACSKNFGSGKLVRLQKQLDRLNDDYNRQRQQESPLTNTESKVTTFFSELFSFFGKEKAEDNKPLLNEVLSLREFKPHNQL